LDPVVEVALEHLSSWINIGTGLAAPEDMKAAVEASRLLAAAGYDLRPKEIESWALLHDWTPDGAADLRQVSEGVLKRSRFTPVGSGPAWVPHILAHWRAEAKERMLKAADKALAADHRDV
jgi:hypothetical protein